MTPRVDKCLQKNKELCYQALKALAHYLESLLPSYNPTDTEKKCGRMCNL